MPSHIHAPTPLDATSPLYYLFPNIQLTFGNGVVSLIKIYPDPANPGDPGRSRTRVIHYFSQELIDQAEQAGDNVKLLSSENAYDRELGTQAVPTLSAFTEVFDSTIEKEDYLMGAHQQRTAESRQIEHMVFGRNEPALHHYHSHFREALGMPPLERIET